MTNPHSGLLGGYSTYSTTLEDSLGREFELGNKVARSSMDEVKISKVTRIENGRVYLDNSKVPMNYPNRLLILKDFP